MIYTKTNKYLPNIKNTNDLYKNKQILFQFVVMRMFGKI